MPGKKSGSISTGSAKTLIEKAKREVPGFRQHFAKFEEQVTIGGYSSGTLYNYSRTVAKVSRVQVPPRVRKSPVSILLAGLFFKGNLVCNFC